MDATTADPLAQANATPTTPTHLRPEPHCNTETGEITYRPPVGCKDEFAYWQEYQARQAWGDLARVAGPRLWPATLDNYQTDHPGQAELLAAIRQYAADLPARVKAGSGIVLFGPSGSGKTHLLVALAKIAIRKYLLGASMWPALVYFEALRGTIGTQRSESDVVKKLTDPAILLLDDPIPPMSRLTDFQAAALQRVVDERWRQQRPTWAALNVADGKEADARLGGPLVDRLRHDALLFHCNWPSYRQAMQTQRTNHE